MSFSLIPKEPIMSNPVKCKLCRGLEAMREGHCSFRGIFSSLERVQLAFTRVIHILRKLDPVA